LLILIEIGGRRAERLSERKRATTRIAADSIFSTGYFWGTDHAE